MGLSSSGAAAFTMAWFHPELYHRVLAYSPTMVNQQWPHDPSLRGGAWEYHSAWAGPAGPNLNVKAGVLTPSEPPGAPLIPSAPTKPIRFWFEVGDQDLFYPNPAIPDGMHDWTLVERAHGEGAGRQGLPLPVPVRAQRQARRPPDHRANPAGGAGMAVEGLSDSLRWGELFEELPKAIGDMLAHDGPAMLDVVTAKQELSMPPTITVEQIKGFSLWVLRAVMSGRGDEERVGVRGTLHEFNSRRVPLTRIASAMRSDLSPQAGRGGTEGVALSCAVGR